MFYKNIISSALILLVIFSFSGFAPYVLAADDVEFTWAKTIGGTLQDGNGSIAIDSSGNVYTTGFFQDTVDFDPGAGTSNLTSAGNLDIFISKLDTDGDFMWAKRLSGTDSEGGVSITVDSSGNVYTTGYFNSTVDFDPGAGTSNLTSAGNTDIFISKLDTDGDFVWAKRMGGTEDDRGASIAVDSSGNVYTTGPFYDTVDFDPGAGTSNLTAAGVDGEGDFFISKLDTDGDFVWAKAMGGIIADESTSITIDTSGNVYTTGSFQDTVDFDPGAGTSNLTAAGVDGESDTFISKLDTDGDFVWAKAMGGISSEIGRSITTDPSGNVYTTGYFQATADFDPGAGTSNLTSAGDTDIFISKLDTAGDFVWVKRIGEVFNDSGTSITTDSSGNVYTIGYFRNTVDFDPGAGTSNLASVANGDFFISKLDTDGDFVWAKAMGGIGDEELIFITVDSSENVYAVGQFYDTVDFDPGAGTSNLISAGQGDVFISKLSAMVTTYSLTYTAGANGTLTGTASQTINEGADGTAVTAVPNAGYRFLDWSDASTANPRTDTNITADLSVTANFEIIPASNSSGSRPRSYSGGSKPEDANTSNTSNNTDSNSNIANTIQNYIFTKTLRVGSTSEDVKELQKYLNANGFPVALSGPGSLGNETNFFGRLTKSALMFFQKSKGLVPDGIMGPITRGVINGN